MRLAAALFLALVFAPPATPAARAAAPAADFYVSPDGDDH